MAKPAFEVTKLECDAFDTRVVERQIVAGRVTRKDLQKHLAGLPDEADNAEEIIVGIGDEVEADEADTEAEGDDA
ncbi:MAG: hypothetical protein GY898_18910 [Proteobacteria bacterium]|nr:hypothetical protein [Pseudomonadota bacterium]